MVVPTPTPPLPLENPEAVPVSGKFSVQTQDGKTVYFHYLEPIWSHAEGDRAGQRIAAVQLAERDGVTQAGVAAAVGVAAGTINRWVRLFREHGTAGLDRLGAPRQRTALTPEQQQSAADRLHAGRSLRSVASELGVNRETLRQYQRSDSLPEPQAASVVVAKPEVPEPEAAKLEAPEPAALERTARDARDAAAAMGRAARDVAGRVAASCGLGAPRTPHFEHLAALPWGGLLVTLPTLLRNGLLSWVDLLPPLRRGFYNVADVLLLLAMLLLARQHTAQSLARQAPGEWGALLGLDRVPDVKTFRAKLHALAADEAAVRAWHAALAGAWMEDEPEVAATVCFDGHVQTYGGQGHLARHFVSRQKLCLPAATSYWMNALGGQPFLCLHVDVDRGLIQALRDDLLPQLRAQGRLPAEGHDLTRPGAGPPALTVVFDREGWSPDLFAQLAREGVACLTWRKGAKTTEPWPRSRFAAHDVQVAVPGGQRHAKVLLAECPLELPTEHGGTVRLREIRRWDEHGRQVSMVTTHRHWSLAEVAGAMLARWSHENYFRVMRQDFGLDRLPEYVVEPLDADSAVPNPDLRRLERLIKDLDTARTRRHEQARKATARGDAAGAAEHESEAAQLLAAATLARAQRWRYPKHVPAGELAPDDRLEVLAQPLRLLYDTVRMLAYRAETQLLPWVGPDGGHGRQPQPTAHRHPRQVLQTLYATPATLRPDPQRGLLRVELLHLPNPALDRAVAPLLAQLNATATRFPGTDLQLHYSLATAAPA